jgi:PAS domain S-box-containing protein
MFGYNKEEIIGQPIEILIPDRVKPNHEKVRAGFYKNPANRVMGHGRDLYGRKKDGTDLPVEVSLSYYTRDEEMFVIAFIINITQRKEIENNMIRQQKELERISTEIRKLNTDLEAKVEERTLILKEALQRLEQSQAELSEALDKERQLNEIKSRFVSMASHEFRTPLSTVLSSASLLGKYTTVEDQDKRLRHIDKIKGSVKHLNDILEDFLSLGKLDEGRVESRPVEFDLEDLIKDTVDEIKGLLKKGQQIKISYEGTRLVAADKKLLKNVMINLITNAIKFSDEGQEIDIITRANTETAMISVEDHGIGISEEDLEHLFTSFFRGTNATNIQGTGLGLHIVKRYLNLMGGTADITTVLDQGTTVSITIPTNKPII